MEIVDFKEEHAEWLGDAEGKYATLAKQGMAYTLMNSQPIFCAGAAVFWPGVAEAWFLRGEEVTQHPVSVIRSTMLMIAETIGKLHLHRLQATILSTDERGIRFIEGLGFHSEGLMQGFGTNKENYYLYARIM